MVRLESRMLITYCYGRIGARILLEVPEKCQSPHTHTQTVAALKYMMMMTSLPPHISQAKRNNTYHQVRKCLVVHNVQPKSAKERHKRIKVNEVQQLVFSMSKINVF